MDKAEVKEKPILFSGPMVRAILEGRKSMTRRIIKPTPPEDWNPMPICGTDSEGNQTLKPSLRFWSHDGDFETVFRGCLYPPKTRLWVRETWATNKLYDNVRPGDLFEGFAGIFYRAEFPKAVWDMYKWRPSIFMPRWASRIALEVTNVRVERLQSISSEDAIEEGVTLPEGLCDCAPYELPLCNIRQGEALVQWQNLWGKINGAQSWAANPFVWVYEFKRVEK